jgi:uncharacterized protein YggE
MSCSKTILQRDNTLDVFGVGRVEFVANHAVIYFEVYNYGRNFQEVFNKTKDKKEILNHVYSELKIMESDITISKIVSKRLYDNNNDFKGYSSEQNIKVIFENLDILEVFLEKIISHEDIIIENIIYSNTNEVEYEIQAELIALENAKKQAQEMADLNKITLGKIRGISINTYRHDIPRTNKFDYSYGDNDGKWQQVAIKIVEVRYEIK